jgi:hypothetical protein
MGFFDKNKSKQRKRKRTRIISRKLPPLSTINFIAVADELPPNTREAILTWEPEMGHDVIPAHIVRDHILDDTATFGYNRVTHWAHLEKQ